jgi:hypothetical protein
MLLKLWQLIIDKTKDVYNNLFCGHEFAFLYGLFTYSLAFS